MFRRLSWGGGKTQNFYPEALDKNYPDLSPVCNLSFYVEALRSPRNGSTYAALEGMSMEQTEDSKNIGQRAFNAVHAGGDKTQSLSIFDREMDTINTLLSTLSLKSDNK